MGQPVLVHVGKLVELPEGVAPEPLPSIVGLQPLDVCLRSWVDAPDFVSAFPRRHLPITEDGKFQAPGAAFGQGVDSNVGEREFVDEVVEGGSEVVDAVSDDEAKVGGRLLQHFEPRELVEFINIELRPNSVRAFLGPGFHFGFKVLQVMERPVEPPFVVEGHDWQNGGVRVDKRGKKLTLSGEPSQ
jgi:hypothetical protein